MCGISGIVSKNILRDSDIADIQEMNSALYHRGPDSEGFYRGGNISLAMRRLKIIDLAGGDQPLFNEDGSIALVANGEVYNHVELRDELEKRGHTFRTHSDCETILHLYEESGDKCLERLRGMFAFALYDSKTENLLIARDRLGEKPLYYCRRESEIVFSSEMKSILAYLRKKGLDIDYNSVNMYLHYQYVPEPFTCIEGVYKLPAAHYMVVSLRDFSSRICKYWDYEDIKPVSGNPPELIRESFDDLCRIIIRADVPVGIALSGGIDSSALAVYAAKYYREKMHAFSVGYPGRPENDERIKAKELAKKVGLVFHDVELRTEDLVAMFPDLVYYMDDPIADIAAYGYYSVNRLAREHGVPVLLTGIGGDELFWGYEWTTGLIGKNILKQEIQSGNRTDPNLSYIWNAASGIQKREMLRNPIAGIKTLLKNIKAERSRLTENPGRFIYYDTLPDFAYASEVLPDLYTDDVIGRIDEGKLYSFFTAKDWDDVPLKICKFQMETWLYSNCVALGDRMSMASSVECRLPFLDYKFVELVFGLRKTYGDDYKLGYKRWFIEAMRDAIPEDILKRKKRGFTPPVEEWYRGVVNRYGRLCLEGFLVSNNIIKREGIADFISKAEKGKPLFVFYKLVLLEIWCRKFIMGETDVR